MDADAGRSGGWDVIVVGGGIIGLATARALARRGAGVLVLEGSLPQRGATWAAGGMLSPLPESSSPEFLALAAASLDRYPAFVASLEAESGLDVGYRRSGKLHVGFGPADAPLLDRLLRSPHAADFGVRPVGAAAARALEPVLAPAITGGVLVERDHHVDNRALAEAAATAARGAGVELRHAQASGMAIRAGRMAGVRLQDGATLHADAVVVAAGSRSGELRFLPRPLPTRPVRGEMVALRAPAPPLERVVVTPRCYLIPRPDGRVVVGATEEDVGYAPGPTAAGIGALLAAAVEAAPASPASPWRRPGPGTARARRTNCPSWGWTPRWRGWRRHGPLPQRHPAGTGDGGGGGGGVRGGGAAGAAGRVPTRAVRGGGAGCGSRRLPSRIRPRRTRPLRAVRGPHGVHRGVQARVRQLRLHAGLQRPLSKPGLAPSTSPTYQLINGSPNACATAAAMARKTPSGR